jgi:hypothetical protein
MLVHPSRAYGGRGPEPNKLFLQAALHGVMWQWAFWKNIMLAKISWGLKYKGVKLTSLFHTNLIPNLEKMKIFMLGVKIYANIAHLNLDAMSFAKSAFSPFVRTE